MNTTHTNEEAPMPVYYAEYSDGRDTCVICPDCAVYKPAADKVMDLESFTNAWPDGYTCDDCAAIVPGVYTCDECDDVIDDGNWYYNHRDEQRVCASCYGEKENN